MKKIIRTITLTFIYMTSCSSGITEPLEKHFKICWGGPENQFSSIELYSDYITLSEDSVFVEKRKFEKNIEKIEFNFPYDKANNYIIVKAFKNLITVNAYLLNGQSLYLTNYYYKNNRIYKIVKYSLGWQIVANLSKDEPENWQQEKLIYNPEKKLIYHEIVKYDGLEKKWIKKILINEKELWPNVYHKEFLMKYYKIFNENMVGNCNK